MVTCRIILAVVLRKRGAWLKYCARFVKTFIKPVADARHAVQGTKCKNAAVQTLGDGRQTTKPWVLAAVLSRHQFHSAICAAGLPRSPPTRHKYQGSCCSFLLWSAGRASQSAGWQSRAREETARNS